MKLVAKEINKSIRGKKILRNISLEMEGGRVYGFIGRNGSGKTMLFRALSGLMRIDSGEIWLDDSCLHRDYAVLPSMGIVLENCGLYPDKTGFENLKYLAQQKKIVGTEEILNALDRVGLDREDKRNYRKYSLGMKQRLAIAQAIMEKPDVILLDEPTNSLDDDGINRIRQIILEEKQRGALILIASHNKEDIQLLSDEVFRIEDGSIVG